MRTHAFWRLHNLQFETGVTERLTRPVINGALDRMKEVRQSLAMQKANAQGKRLGEVYLFGRAN